MKLLELSITRIWGEPEQMVDEFNRKFIIPQVDSSEENNDILCANWNELLTKCQVFSEASIM